MRPGETLGGCCTGRDWAYRAGGQAAEVLLPLLLLQLLGVLLLLALRDLRLHALLLDVGEHRVVVVDQQNYHLRKAKSAAASIRN